MRLPIASLPHELLREFLQELSLQSLLPLQILLAVDSGLEWSCCFQSYSIPGSLRANFCSRLLPGLTKLDFGGGVATDDFLQSLSSSRCAATLQELDLGTNNISDATAHCWKEFKQLFSLKLVSEFAMKETLHAVVSLETLRLLSFRSELISSVEVAAAAMSKMTNLNGLRLDMPPYYSPAELAEVLERFPAACASLRELYSAESRPISIDNAAMVAELCPNLEVFPNVEGTLSSIRTQPLRLLSRLSRLSITVETGPSTQEDIDWLAAAVPNLSSLYLRHANGIAATTASSLRSLSLLGSLSMYNVTQLPLLPDCLFSLSSAFMKNMDASAVLSSMLSRNASIRNLIHLDLEFAEGCVTPELFQQLLDSCRMLESVRLRAPVAKPPAAPVSVSHPSLRRMPAASLDGCKLVPGYLPAATELGPTDLDFKDFGVQQISKAMPNLVSIEVPQELGALSPLGALLHLQTLELHNPTEQQLAELKGVKSLRDLAISDVAGTSCRWVAIRELIESLPRLRFCWLRDLLDSSIAIATEDLPAHPLLCYLYLDGVRLAPSNNSQSLLRLSATKLPSLSFFHAQIDNHRLPCRVELDSLPNLEKVNLAYENMGWPPSYNPTEVVIRNCPRLVKVGIKLAGMSHLQMQALPALLELEISESMIPSAGDCGVLLPSLLLVTLSRTPAISETTPEEFCRILRRSAAKFSYSITT